MRTPPRRRVGLVGGRRPPVSSADWGIGQKFRPRQFRAVIKLGLIVNLLKREREHGSTTQPNEVIAMV